MSSWRFIGIDMTGAQSSATHLGSVYCAS